MINTIYPLTPISNLKLYPLKIRLSKENQSRLPLLFRQFPYTIIIKP